jgi:predicted PurR-regulated permease PerM
MSSGKLIEQLAAISALVILVGGSLLVLLPFMTALLWGAILAFSSWRVYMTLSRWLYGRRGLAALPCVLVTMVVVLGPFVYGGISLAEHVGEIAGLAEHFNAQSLSQLQLPEWVVSLPYIGGRLQGVWHTLTQTDAALWEHLRKLVAPAGHVLLGAGIAIGAGLGQLTLSVILAFFFYSEGEAAVAWLRAGLRRISGDRADYLLELMARTITGVVHGVLGTCFVQGVLAGIGFWIAGVPAPAMLGFATFFLSVLPLGPPIIWIPAAFWLSHHGATGWAIFIVVWGIGVVGMSEQILKPLLISKGMDMPLIWVMLGIFGGAIAFGLLGVFIGPTLLAVGYALLRDWSIGSVRAAAKSASPPPRPPAIPENKAGSPGR